MEDIVFKDWLNDFLMFSKQSKEFVFNVNKFDNIDLLFEICTAISVGVPEEFLKDISDDTSVDTVKKIRDNFLREKYNVDVTNVIKTSNEMIIKLSKIENVFETAIAKKEESEKMLKNELSIKENELHNKQKELDKLKEEYSVLEKRLNGIKQYDEDKHNLGQAEHKQGEKDNSNKKDENKYTTDDNYKARIAFVKYLENYFCDKNIPEENKDFFLEFIEKDDTDFEMLMQAAKVKNLSVTQMKRLYEAMKRDIDLKK